MTFLTRIGSKISAGASENSQKPNYAAHSHTSPSRLQNKHHHAEKNAKNAWQPNAGKARAARSAGFATPRSRVRGKPAGTRPARLRAPRALSCDADLDGRRDEQAPSPQPCRRRGREDDGQDPRRRRAEGSSATAPRNDVAQPAPRSRRRKRRRSTPSTSTRARWLVTALDRRSHRLRGLNSARRRKRGPRSSTARTPPRGLSLNDWRSALGVSWNSVRRRHALQAGLRELVFAATAKGAFLTAEWTGQVRPVSADGDRLPGGIQPNATPFLRTGRLTSQKSLLGCPYSSTPPSNKLAICTAAKHAADPEAMALASKSQPLCTRCCRVLQRGRPVL